MLETAAVKKYTHRNACTDTRNACTDVPYCEGDQRKDLCFIIMIVFHPIFRQSMMLDLHGFDFWTAQLAIMKGKYFLP